MNSLSFQDKYNLQIKIKTWIRKAKNIYDFKATSEEYEFSTLLINETGYVCRSENKINFIHAAIKNKSMFKDLKFLLRAKCSKNKFFIDQTPNQKRIWKVIGNDILKNDIFKSNYMHEMKVNDVIKLGSIMFVVKNVNLLIDNSEHTFIDTKDFDIIINRMENDICKFCLQNNDEFDNPFINLCKCKGSLNIVHLSCLKIWLNHNTIKKVFPQKHMTIYYIKSYNCEICLEPFPIQIKCGNKYLYLVNIDLPLDKDYILLQKITISKDTSLSLILFSFNESIIEYFIGRNTKNDLSLLDSSISNTHCKLSLSNGKIYLSDCESKFGTLVLSKEEQIEVIANQKVIIQVGSTLLNFSLIPIQRNCSYFPSHFRSKNKKSILSIDSNFYKAFKTADLTNVYFKSQLALLQKEEFEEEEEKEKYNK